jgi:hypothetical protein
MNEMPVRPEQELNHGERIIHRVLIDVKRMKKFPWSTLSKEDCMRRQTVCDRGHCLYETYTMETYTMAPHTSVVERYGWDERDARVDLVNLVYLVQPNKRNRPDKQERPAGPRASRATVCIAGGLFQYPAKARGIAREGEDVLCSRPGMSCIKKEALIALQQWSPDNA